MTVTSTQDVLDALADQRILAESYHGPTEVCIPVYGGRILITREFNRDGWEAAYEDDDTEDQTSLIDGPDDPNANPHVVAGWVLTLVRTLPSARVPG